MNFVKSLLKAPVLVLSFAVLLIFKFIQPVIRFQLCVVGFHRYGHLALEPEIFLAEREIAEKKKWIEKALSKYLEFGTAF